jgi:hypothetical protein
LFCNIRNAREIYLEDQEQMAEDESRAERCSAAKKVQEAVKDLPDLPRLQDVHTISDPLLQKR